MTNASKFPKLVASLLMILSSIMKKKKEEKISHFLLWPLNLSCAIKVNELCRWCQWNVNKFLPVSSVSQFVSFFTFCWQKITYLQNQFHMGKWHHIWGQLLGLVLEPPLGLWVSVVSPPCKECMQQHFLKTVAFGLQASVAFEWPSLFC